MAMTAKDGTRHHSASRARMHDEMQTANPSAPAKPTAAPDQNAMGGGDVSNMPIHEVVKAHGPAHKVEIEHDHKMMKHKKTSHHGKMKHVSEHDTASEAHDHGKMAAGAEETPDEENETPDDANASLEGGADDQEQKVPGLNA